MYINTLFNVSKSRYIPQMIESTGSGAALKTALPPLTYFQCPTTAAISSRSRPIPKFLPDVGGSREIMPHSSKVADPLPASWPSAPNQKLPTRVRCDQTTWRMRFMEQAHALQSKSTQLGKARLIITKLTSTIVGLRARVDDSATSADRITAIYHELSRRQRILIETLEISRLRIARLKKSDRAKDKVQQRNMVLKMLLNNARQQVKENDDSEAHTLKEALAAAMGRIRDLEDAGKELSDALTRQDEGSNASDDEDESTKSRDLGFNVAVAEVQFKEILEDDHFEELKTLWGDILRE
ncbi:hypothetical protein B0J11DRAFT_503365 [Dendryphion nanum]|uniref:Uncharacterized protein n=1 Tax=Dendryphion nanum TaxID=256645 RepID=A0A9P9E4E1_9PLEO|nr:hypothetical protein B0J11DRAFT_503365 [Dendryphion nanum]